RASAWIEKTRYAELGLLPSIDDYVDIPETQCVHFYCRHPRKGGGPSGIRFQDGSAPPLG
ncbi:MAG TPA: hypothetical protein VK629_02125, partial [Steroidobacteraceae bacterium]|nr:hypothetical protein [Steroidobacteraceae bacterium]